jgi:hypothetical protein
MTGALHDFLSHPNGNAYVGVIGKNGWERVSLKKHKITNSNISYFDV